MQNIRNIGIGVIISFVTKAVEKFKELSNNLNPEKKSGYFTMRREKDGRVIFVAQVNECPPEKADKYFNFSLEKGARLKININHSSSWQSRDEGKERWGGAIRTKDFILSFSGLPELGDEAVMLITALHFSWLKKEEVTAIASLSNNPFISELWNVYR